VRAGLRRGDQDEIQRHDRAVLEAADRFAEARLKRREQSGNAR